jgi:hypothetical protein
MLSKISARYGFYFGQGFLHQKEGLSITEEAFTKRIILV